MSRAVPNANALHCRDLIRKTDADRLLLAELAPAGRRPALWALAAFNWEVARIPERVSEPMLGMIRRQWWRDAWVEIADGRPRRHPVAEALADAHAATPFDLAAIERLLDAREKEQDGPHRRSDRPGRKGRGHRRRARPAEATALGLANPSAGAPAGTAWALIGGLRGLPQSLAAGRHQLPEDLLARHDIRLDRLQPEALAEGFPHLIETIAGAADLEPAPGNGRMPALFRGYARLVRLYRNRLARAGWNPFDSRINAPTAGRALAVLGVRLGL